MCLEGGPCRTPRHSMIAGVRHPFGKNPYELGWLRMTIGVFCSRESPEKARQFEMANGPIQSWLGKAAGFRWYLPLWLVAAFAAIQLPLAAQALPGGRAALVEPWSGQALAGKSAVTSDSQTVLIEEHRLPQPDVGWVVGDNVDDAFSRHILRGRPGPAPLGSGLAALWHMAGDASAFNSRAPPHLS